MSDVLPICCKCKAPIRVDQSRCLESSGAYYHWDVTIVKYPMIEIGCPRGEEQLGVGDS